MRIDVAPAGIPGEKPTAIALSLQSDTGELRAFALMEPAIARTVAENIVKAAALVDGGIVAATSMPTPPTPFRKH